MRSIPTTATRSRNIGLPPIQKPIVEIHRRRGEEEVGSTRGCNALPCTAVCAYRGHTRNSRGEPRHLPCLSSRSISSLPNDLCTKSSCGLVITNELVQFGDEHLWRNIVILNSNLLRSSYCLYCWSWCFGQPLAKIISVDSVCKSCHNLKL